jgi:hypothetical protein
VAAKGKAGDPPDVPKPRDQRAGGREWLQSILSRFGPVKERASNTTVLDFEKPLVELDNRIKEVRQGGQQAAARGKTLPHAPPPPALLAAPAQTLLALSLLLQVRQVAEENGVDVSNQIKELEERAKQVGTQLQPSPLPRTGWPVLPECCLQAAAARAWCTQHAGAVTIEAASPALAPVMPLGHRANPNQRTQAPATAPTMHSTHTYVLALWRLPWSAAPAAAQGHVQPADAGAEAAGGAAPQPPHLPGHCPQHL